MSIAASLHTVARTIREEPWELLSWVAAALFLAFHLHPLISDRALAGWDLVPQYTLYESFLKTLAQGKLSSYNLLQLGGYPEFSLYSPGGYLLLGLPHLLSAGLISAQLSFNTVVATLPLLFLVALWWTARIFGGRTAGGWAVLLGSFYLASPPEFAFYGSGLFSLLDAGLVHNFAALPLLVVLLGVLERGRVSQRPNLWLLAVLFGAITLVHLLSAIFAGWLLLCYLVATASWRARGRLLAGAGLSLLFSGWWLSELLRHLPFSSSITTGLWGGYPDPLFYLIPGVNPQRFVELWARGAELVSIPGIAALRTAQLPAALLYFPFAGVLTALGIAAALRHHCRSHQLFLPLLTLVTLIVLPRSFLADGSPSGLHFYRFVQGTVVLGLCLASSGLAAVSQSIASARPLLRFLTIVIWIPLLGWSIFANNFALLSLRSNGALDGRGFYQYRFNHLLFRDEYPDHRQAEEMMAHLRTLPLTGRVAAESPIADQDRLGSPHLFNSELPRRFSIPVAAGLLLESSPVTPLLLPTLYNRSFHVRWADNELEGIPEFTTQSFSSMIDRLKQFSVQYILASSLTYKSALRELPASTIRSVFKIGPYELFELTQTAPLLQVSAQRPALFVGTTREFRTFSKHWYLVPELHQFQVIFSPNGLDSISPSEWGRIGAILLPSSPRSPTSALTAYEIGKRFQKPVIVFGPKIGSALGVWSVTADSPVQQGERLAETFHGVLGIPPKRLPIAQPQINSDRISFTAVGSVISSLGYAPDWRSSDPEQTVFIATPASLFVFSDGDTTLLYNK